MTDRSNLIVVLSDQHRADALSCAGSVVETPNLDCLAERGVRCTGAYTSSPVCVPARASMYAGVYPHNTHVLSNSSWLTEGGDTWATHLQDAGYYTAHIGEAHQRSAPHLRDNEPYIESLGFQYVHEVTGQWSTLHHDSYMTDEWKEKGVYEVFCRDYRERQANVDSDNAREAVDKCTWASPLSVEDHMDSYVGRQAVEFVERYDREEPFAAFVGIPGPHGPMDPPGRYAELYDPADVEAPVPLAEPPDWVPENVAAEGRNDGWAPAYWNEQLAREYRAAYYGKISLIDHWMGELVDALERRGMLEKTVIVYTADHGEFAGDHGRFGKSTFHEQSARIPLIAAGPGIAEGATTDALASLVDLYPTLLDAAGVGGGETLGTSLLPLLSDPDITVRDAAYAVIGDRAMVATDRYTYGVTDSGSGYVLWDRKRDPDQQRVLVGHPDYVEVERDLRDRLLAFYHETSTRYRRRDDAYIVT